MKSTLLNLKHYIIPQREREREREGGEMEIPMTELDMSPDGCEIYSVCQINVLCTSLPLLALSHTRSHIVQFHLLTEKPHTFS